MVFSYIDEQSNILKLLACLVYFPRHFCIAFARERAAEMGKASTHGLKVYFRGVFVLLFAFIIQAKFAHGHAEREATGPLIIVSLDGLRWQFIEDGYANMPSFEMIAENGVTAKYIKTVMPSKTWPNHHSYMTGLWAESHGTYFFSFAISQRLTLETALHKTYLHTSCVHSI